jgi:hypothetical protein
MVVFFKRLLTLALYFAFGLLGGGVAYGLAIAGHNPYDVAHDFQTLMAATIALGGAVIAFRAAQIKIESDNEAQVEKKRAIARSIRAQTRTLCFQGFAFARRMSASAEDISQNLASVEGFARMLEELCKRGDSHVTLFSEQCSEMTAEDIESVSSLVQRFEGLLYDLKIGATSIRMFPRASPGPRLAQAVQYMARFIEIQVMNVASEFPGSVDEWTAHLANVESLGQTMRTTLNFDVGPARTPQGSQ